MTSIGLNPVSPLTAIFSESKPFADATSMCTCSSVGGWMLFSSAWYVGLSVHSILWTLQ